MAFQLETTTDAEEHKQRFFLSSMICLASAEVFVSLENPDGTVAAISSDTGFLVRFPYRDYARRDSFFNRAYFLSMTGH